MTENYVTCILGYKVSLYWLMMAIPASQLSSLTESTVVRWDISCWFPTTKVSRAGLSNWRPADGCITCRPNPSQFREGKMSRNVMWHSDFDTHAVENPAGSLNSQACRKVSGCCQEGVRGCTRGRVHEMCSMGYLRLQQRVWVRVWGGEWGAVLISVGV